MLIMQLTFGVVHHMLPALGNHNRCCARTIHEIHTQIVLNPTRVGSSFFSEAQISVNEVNSVKKYSHHTLIPKINPGTMIQALAAHEANSTVL